ncbi:39S ribosomal protein L23, mitochondrial isoform X1 [Phodopus roborovskii]|uniref:39S ribosomal protein L23, mitochondrial isoform X1 n=1 Tax=Phodopus roborovskii TaxID=109678 RepID=UPI0021E3EA8B|nr:39S ribosomal protein L23, mitochondrial isoform X1 [Phodopus roborovskii]
MNIYSQPCPYNVVFSQLGEPACTSPKLDQHGAQCFTGLGAPRFDPHATPLVISVTLGSLCLHLPPGTCGQCASSTPSTSLVAPSSVCSEPTSSSSWCGLVLPSLKTLCNSGSPWSKMTRVDLRNYLEQIYNVPVAAVRTRVQHGSNRRRDHKSVRIKKPDYKVAYVQLAHGQTFTFPDLFPEKEPSPADPLEEEPQQQRQSSDPRCPGIPSWFGL